MLIVWNIFYDLKILFRKIIFPKSLLTRLGAPKYLNQENLLQFTYFTKSVEALVCHQNIHYTFFELFYANSHTMYERKFPQYHLSLLGKIQ
jgi:hypothetical protein